MRSISALLVACVLTAGLAACSGGHAGNSAVPSANGGSAKSSLPNRRTQSSCVPDSYGYCLAPEGSTSSDKICYPVWHYQTIVFHYELYYNGNAAGAYDKTEYNNWCDDTGTVETWSPQDPAQATGDPNLP